MVTPVAMEPMLGYHPCSIGFLTSHRDPVIGQCQAGSLTCLLYTSCSQNKTYTSYETVSTVEHSSTVNTLYTEYNGKLLKYSKDGISCIDSQNEAIWSQTYNMQNPMVDICEGAVAVADQQGNIVSVSYTHLDVYKRQFKNRADIPWIMIYL